MDQDSDGFDDSCENYDIDPCSVYITLDNCGNATGKNCNGCLLGTTRTDSCAGGAKSPLGTVDILVGATPATSAPNGSYMLVPIDGGLYAIHAEKPGYFNADILNYPISNGTNYLDINMTPGYGELDCLSDCSTLGEIGKCGPCDCLNGCQYSDTIAVSRCAGKLVGEVVPYNSTHQIRCCEGTPYTLERIPAIVTVNSTNVVTIQRIVWFEGRIVKMMISVFQ